MSEDNRETKRLRTGDFVGSLDQGTTSTRFIIFNTAGEPVASHQVELVQKYPQSGYASSVPPNYKDLHR